MCVSMYVCVCVCDYLKVLIDGAYGVTRIAECLQVYVYVCMYVCVCDYLKMLIDGAYEVTRIAECLQAYIYVCVHVRVRVFA
jgi:hypothetical protein